MTEQREENYRITNAAVSFAARQGLPFFGCLWEGGDTSREVVVYLMRDPDDERTNCPWSYLCLGLQHRFIVPERWQVGGAPDMLVSQSNEEAGTSMDQ